MKVKILFAIFMMFAAISFADKELSLQQIIENSATCVKEINDNRIYLKENYLIISDDGIYLLLNENGDTARVPELCSDSFGCFINIALPVKNYQMGWYYDVTKKCPGCGEPYFVYCKNKNCPLKNKKKERE